MAKSLEVRTLSSKEAQIQGFFLFIPFYPEKKRETTKSQLTENKSISSSILFALTEAAKKH
ncbi:hypothetical protein [Pedobacter sp. R-06]|uniref:hypothetical protein n=1 Tax=Pedobacter sp. R-06 TaxID=3404051 RepID=UPI003CF8172C